MASNDCDITLKDLPTLCDVFYIGGTKVGALFGECVVARKGLLKHFFPLIKQHGALLAKGRLLGIQFETLFTDNLYFEIARHANVQAKRIRDAFVAKGYKLLMESPTNQQFPILPNELVAELRKKFSFESWGFVDEGHTAVRFCTSWATTDEAVDSLLSEIAKL